MKAIPNHISYLLDEANIAYLCTVNPKGQPIVTPIFFVFNRATQSIFFLTSKNSQKFKNLLHNPRAALTVDLRDPVNPFNNRGVTIQGYTATGGDVTPSKAGMSPSVRGIYQLFEESYSNFGEEFFRSFAKGSDDTGSDMVLIELKPVKIVHWEGPTFKAVKLWPLID